MSSNLGLAQQLAAEQAGIAELERECKKYAAYEQGSFRQKYGVICSWNAKVQELKDKGIQYPQKALVEMFQKAGVMEKLTVHTVGRWQKCYKRWRRFPDSEHEQAVLRVFLNKKESENGLKAEDLESATYSDLQAARMRRKSQANAAKAAKATKDSAMKDPESIRKMVQNAVTVASHRGHSRDEIISWVDDALKVAASAAA